MKEQLTNRLAQFKAEYESGQQMLAELDEKQRTLRETMLRISGAIQVLEEELGKFAHDAVVGYRHPVSRTSTTTVTGFTVLCSVRRSSYYVCNR